MQSVSTLSTRFRFGRPATENFMAVMVDGKDTFEQMCDRISRAEKSILIANYDLDPGLKFARSYPGAGNGKSGLL
jgi:phosphatidylserine/phosphatidylglycerophosphate/cardiolipin synthase-like enzyme